MAVSIALAFGWAFYLPNGLVPFIALLFVLGFFGGNFALFSLWLPEQFETRVRATAFAFCTSIGRFFGAIVNFGIGAMVLHMKTLGVPIALTAIAFRGRAGGDSVCAGNEGAGFTELRGMGGVGMAGSGGRSGSMPGCTGPASRVSGLVQCRVAAFQVFARLVLAVFFITISHCAWRRVISLSKATKKRSKENAFTALP